MLDIAKAKKFQHRVADTTVAFFARFYLKQSMARYPPQMVLFCCIIVAIKAENLSDYVTAFQLFGDAGQTFKLGDALKLEPILLDVLSFDIMILHGEGPLTLMNNEYYHWRRRRRALDCPSTFQPTADGAGEPFVEFLTAMQNACEKLYLDLYATDIHFLCTPAEVAVGIFAYVTKTVYGLPDVDDFLLSLQPEGVRSDPKQTQQFTEKAALIAHVVFEFQEQDKAYDVSFWGPAVADIMKEVRRWSKLVQGASKRKRALDKAASQSKKVKVDETPTSAS